jgi:hypothetical protein
MKIAGRTLRRLIRESIRQNLRVLSEGGNVFPEVNSAVPKKFLETNIENALEIAGLGDMKYEIVGSKNKPYFGDIDVAVDEYELRKIIGIDKTADMKQVWAALDAYVKGTGSPGHKIIPGLSQVHLLAPLIDDKGSQINAVDREGVDLGTQGMIQIDVFVGHLGWMSSTSSGSPLESKYKAVYRNVLLASIFNNIPVEPTPEEIRTYSKKLPGVEVKKRFLVNFRKGMIERLYYEEKLGKTGKPVKNPTKVTLEEHIVSDANELAQYFLNGTASWEDMNSYEKLMDLVMGKKFKYPSRRAKVIEDFKAGLDDNPVPPGI